MWSDPRSEAPGVRALAGAHSVWLASVRHSPHIATSRQTSP